MKILLLLCFLLGTMSCKNKVQETYNIEDQEIVLTKFTKQADELDKTVRSSIPCMDESGLKEVYPQVVRTKEGWRDARLYFKDSDFPQLLYQSYRQGKVTKEVCMEYFKAWGKDTSECSPLIVREYVAILKGEGEDGQLYVVADNNGNMDFSDDISYVISEKSRPMPLVFERIVGGRIKLDSIWILPKKPRNEEDFSWEYRDIMTTCFALGKQNYVCNLRPGGDAYDEQDCEVEIRTDCTVVRGRLHEYLELSGYYYRIDSIRNDGRYVRMQKEMNPENIRSTQIGFLPFPFVAATVDGDTIHFPDDLKGKYVLLDFWSTGCGPCIQEIKDIYFDLYARYKEKGFEILGVAEDWKEDIVRFRSKIALPWPVIADNEARRQLHKLYNINSWPTLFLLGPDGKIIAEGLDLRGMDLVERLREIFK